MWQFGTGTYPSHCGRRDLYRGAARSANLNGGGTRLRRVWTRAFTRPLNGLVALLRRQPEPRLRVDACARCKRRRARWPTRAGRADANPKPHPTPSDCAPRHPRVARARRFGPNTARLTVAFLPSPSGPTHAARRYAGIYAANRQRSRTASGGWFMTVPCERWQSSRCFDFLSAHLNNTTRHSCVRCNETVFHLHPAPAIALNL